MKTKLIAQLNTPRKFLVWMQNLDARPKRLLRLCGDATKDLSRLEAHTCLILLESSRKGEFSVSTTQLTKLAGREVPTSCMRALEFKEYVRMVPPLTPDQYKTLWWELTPKALEALPRMEAALECLVREVVRTFDVPQVAEYAEKMAAKLEPVTA